jgi:hypothetical protein
MPSYRPFRFKYYLLLAHLLAFPLVAFGQSNKPRLITQQIDDSRAVKLSGNVHFLARTQFDRGPAPDSLQMNRMLLILKRPDSEETKLRSLLDEQQDRSSTSYHQWVTPDEFGEQFGPSDQDIQTVESWLQSHGFSVERTSRGRTIVVFSGTVAEVQLAFHTEIHRYVVNGEEYWANASDPQIPVALEPVVAGLVSLHNFPKQPLHRVAGAFSKSRIDGNVQRLNPDFTFSHSGAEIFALGPYDFAKIYNVLPLWAAGIDGTGQTVAIVGQTNINLQDVRDFRNAFNLPKIDPQIILDGPDPGVVPNDETEADLDVEWSGAVAKGATIKLVVSASTNSTSGVDLSALYIVDNDLAPVLSESYGACELFLGSGNNQFYGNLWEQAAAQGMTVVVATGDSGAAACDRYQGDTPEPASGGLMVNGVASTPFNVAVGGTDLLNFGEVWSAPASGPSLYWNINNDLNQASVNGYVPESTWNDSCTNSALGGAPTSNTEANCNLVGSISNVLTVGGGGGVSNCTSSDGVQPLSCSGGYSKPSWQTGDGVPNDNARDLPDVSLFAGNGLANSFYIVCESDEDPNGASCEVSSSAFDFLAVGGTSASAPTFAGTLALVNQYTNSHGVGNANYVLYRIPALASQKALNCASTAPPGAGCILNDIVSGTIAMPCATFKSNCDTANPADIYGVLSGYAAATGYDLATGLGSINANNLVHAWSSVTFIPTQTTLNLNSGQPVQILHGQTVPFAAAVTSNSGTPTGQVSLVADTIPGEPAGTFSLSNGSATGNASQLPGGTYTVTARYAGEGEFGGSSSAPSLPITVQPEASSTAMTILTFDPVGNLVPFTGGPYGSFVYLRADVSPAAPSSSGVSSVPGGTVSFLDTYNGTQSGVAGNPYSINSLGYTVTPRGILNFPAGTHSISANYSGDNSYTASNSPPSGTFTISPVSTWVDFLYSISPSNTAPFGTSITIYATVYTTSFGNSPTGTITFFEGSTQLGNPVPLVAGIDSLTQHAIATASLALPPLQDGPNQITGNYNGDTNYLSSSGFGYLYEQIGTTTTVTTSTATVTQGTPVTFTAHVTANQPGGPSVNGSVDFVERASGSQFGYYIAQNVPLTNGVAQLTTNDSASDFLQAGSITVSAISGTNDYYTSSTGGVAENVLLGPSADFTITPSVPNVVINAPGAVSNPIILTIVGTGGYNGTINLAPSSCSISPAGSLSSCSFSPSSVFGSGSAQVTIQTTAPQGVALVPISVVGGRRTLDLGILIVAFTTLGVLALLRFNLRWQAAAGLLLLISLLAMHGCGGTGGGGANPGGVGNGGGGNQSPGTPTGVSYTVTVTASVPPLSHSTSFTFVVQ